jgi:predicted RNA-binding protein YlqC (UPF0109 family)
MDSAPRSSRIVSPEDVPAQRLLFEIARSLVENVDAVSVDVLDDNGSRTLVVWADADGYGRLIGSQGRTVKAIRTILSASAMKGKRTYSLDIRERVGL